VTRSPVPASVDAQRTIGQKIATALNGTLEHVVPAPHEETSSGNLDSNTSTCLRSRALLLPCDRIGRFRYPPICRVAGPRRNSARDLLLLGLAEVLLLGLVVAGRAREGNDFDPSSANSGGGGMSACTSSDNASRRMDDHPANGRSPSSAYCVNRNYPQ
jgi:hypothetical protein